MNNLAQGALGPVFNPQGNTYQGQGDYFFYPTTPAQMAAAARATSLIQIDADSQFALLALTYQANIAAATLTDDTDVVPLLTVAIQDGGSGKYLMTAPVPINCIAGRGKEPYRLIGPRIFQPNSTVNFNWVNYSAATTYDITLVLHGVKLYRN